MSSLLQVSESIRNSSGPNNYDCPCQEIVMFHVKMLSSKNYYFCTNNSGKYGEDLITHFIGGP